MYKKYFDIIEGLNNIAIPSGYILDALDIISLFTNIRTYLTPNIERWTRLTEHTKLSLEQLSCLLEFLFISDELHQIWWYVLKTKRLGNGKLFISSLLGLSYVCTTKYIYKTIALQCVFLWDYVNEHYHVCTNYWGSPFY